MFYQSVLPMNCFDLIQSQGLFVEIGGNYGNNESSMTFVWKQIRKIILVGSMSFIATGLVAAQIAFEKDTLTIFSATGKAIKFDIEIASSNEERSQGLMYRKNMADNAGMLFVYSKPNNVMMWMKNTYIPLDMVFIKADGVIENIIQRTVPHSEEVLSATAKVRGVLELNAGITSKLGIKAGDRVIHDIFINMDD